MWCNANGVSILYIDIAKFTNYQNYEKVYILFVDRMHEYVCI